MPSGVSGEYGVLFLWNKGCVFLDKLCHLRIFDEVLPFMRIISQIVELTGTVKVLDKPIIGRPNRIIAQSETGDGGMLPFSLRVLHEGDQALSLLSRVGGQSGQFKQGWKNVE